MQKLEQMDLVVMIVILIALCAALMATVIKRDIEIDELEKTQLAYFSLEDRYNKATHDLATIKKENIELRKANDCLIEYSKRDRCLTQAIRKTPLPDLVKEK